MSSNGTHFLLVGNGSHLNRGCEAILRGTVRILRQSFHGAAFVNANFDTLHPPYIPPESDPRIRHLPISFLKRWHPRWILKQVCDRCRPSWGDALLLSKIRRYIGRANAVLSIGGDNYTLDYGIPNNYIALDRYCKKNGKPLNLWGASVGPFEKHPAWSKFMIGHLQNDVADIFVREDVSKDYLNRLGITGKVHLMGDPAFVMAPESLQPDAIPALVSGQAVGLNLSPLMAKYIPGADRRTWLGLSVQLVKALRRALNRPIVLIPHVVSPHSDDHRFMQDLLQQMNGDAAGICLLPKTYSAPQLKFLISKLGCLIAARTHATIAAFSSMRPTISLAYSRKAVGLNEQLFGHRKYLLTPDQLQPEHLVSLARSVFGEAERICEQLHNRVPHIRQSAYRAGEILADRLSFNTVSA